MWPGFLGNAKPSMGVVYNSDFSSHCGKASFISSLYRVSFFCIDSAIIILTVAVCAVGAYTSPS